jgi:hypothetical protein
MQNEYPLRLPPSQLRQTADDTKQVYDDTGTPAEQIGSFRLAARTAALERARRIRRRERALAEQYFSQLRVGAGWSRSEPKSSGSGARSG